MNIYDASCMNYKMIITVYNTYCLAYCIAYLQNITEHHHRNVHLREC